MAPGIFRTSRWMGFLLGAVLLLPIQPAPAAHDDEVSNMKRRQQGILTGMPFMANITPRTFVDASGRKLFLAKAPSRVVSMAPSVTEILFALGLEEKVVAVTSFCDYPPEAQSKTHLGGMNPSIEQILALKPDLVLAPQDMIQPDLLQHLDRLKVPTFVLHADQLEDVLAQIQSIARLFDRSRAGDELAATIRQRTAVVRERTQSLAHPRVLYVLNTDPLQTVGPGSFIHQLIELAGGANSPADTSMAYPKFALEEVLARDPEVIILRLDELLVKHGLSHQIQWSVTLPGTEGRARIDAAMSALRSAPPQRVGTSPVVRALDAAAGEERVRGERRPSGLPLSDVLAFQSEDGARLIVRPSGTEPKIKFYLELVGRAESRGAVTRARAPRRGGQGAEDRPHDGAAPRMKHPALALVALVVATSGHPEQQTTPPAVDNVLVVTFDGLRWQEVFGGLDRSLNTKAEGGVAKPEDKAVTELQEGGLERYVVVRVADEIVVDLLLSAGGIRFAEAQSEVSNVEVAGVPSPFASPRLLMRMKQTGSEKDTLDLLFLRELLSHSRPD